ncbi:hypothetical protein [Corallococcus llansteffanensis]|uniref:Uncharacterized protein n=1 Tax=Corallococcus llansteffanensis TaxID=2316731 RepID=A0A3A8R130_9BACT|nr:hypothetical protein [Corallococcus llansteffanensis]RKH68994.1 hypothetical protein D7V93_00265 [Corallococcus llansteffanensis]
MSDLPAFIDAHPRDGGPGARGGFAGHAFALALDMEPEDIADSIPLDALVVDAGRAYSPPFRTVGAREGAMKPE